MPSWVVALDPVMSRLLPALSQAIGRSDLYPSTREAAAATLAEALVRRNNIAGFAGPLSDAPPVAFRILIQALQRDRRIDTAIEALEQGPRRATGAGPPRRRRGNLTPEQQANAAVALMILGKPESTSGPACGTTKTLTSGAS